MTDCVRLARLEHFYHCGHEVCHARLPPSHMFAVPTHQLRLLGINRAMRT